MQNQDNKCCINCKGIRNEVNPFRTFDVCMDTNCSCRYKQEEVKEYLGEGVGKLVATPEKSWEDRFEKFGEEDAGWNWELDNSSLKLFVSQLLKEQKEELEKDCTFECKFYRALNKGEKVGLKIDSGYVNARKEAQKSLIEELKGKVKEKEIYAEEDYFYDKGYNEAIRKVKTLLEEYNHDN